MNFQTPDFNPDTPPRREPFKEPTTYAGIGTLFALLSHWIDPHMIQALVQLLGAGAAVAAIVLPERFGRHTPPAE